MGDVENKTDFQGPPSKVISLLGGKTAKLSGLDGDLTVEIKSLPPCTEHCPAGVNAKAYVNLIAAKRYEEAFDVILQNCPFPGVCGRVCTRPCEEFCSLKEVGSVPIRELKRFTSDYFYSRRPYVVSPPTSRESQERILMAKKVAIVGCGPAGLTAGLDLAALNYDVTIFESNETPGGMLNQGIPDYRLPKNVVDSEIDFIRDQGVKIRTGTRIESAEDLNKLGFDALIIATGAMKDVRLPIPGMEKEGVLHCLPFLRSANMDNKVDLDGSVLVLGGGSSAFDCARVAKRIGADKVTVVYRRSIAEMPADHKEIEESQEEGIEILELAIPVRVLGEKKVTGMEFLKAELGEVDDSGRKRPIPIEGTEFQIPCEWVVSAIGFTSDIADFSKELELTDQGTVKVGSYGETNVENISAAGDVALGPSSIIKAIASGHKAAYGVHMKFSEERTQYAKSRMMPIIIDEPDKKESKISPSCLPPQEREGSFSEVNMGFTEYEALLEAARCIRCASCFECSLCLGECSYKQISGNIDGTSFMIKTPIEVSKKIYESPLDAEIVSEAKKEKVHLETLTAKVDSGYCIACGRCEEACPYKAVKVDIKKDEPMAAVVDHDVCKCCGACTAVCPSGAISQGIMSPEKVLNQIQELGKKKKPVIFGCIWGKKDPIFSEDDLIFMCTRMIRPTTLISALAAGNPGVFVNPCFEEEGCHYGSFEPPIEEVVDATNTILDYIGVGSKRLKVNRFNWLRRENELADFSAELEGLGPESLPEIPYEGDNRISRAFNWLSSIWNIQETDNANEGLDEKDETIGLLALLHLLLSAEGFEGLNEVVESVEHIMGCAVTEKNISQIRINSILERIEIPKEHKQRLVIGLIPPSSSGVNTKIILDMLGQIKGIKTITLKPQEAFDLDKLNSRTKAIALDLIKSAEQQDVDFIVPLSILDLAVLKLYSRAGSWLTFDLDIIDIFSLILNIQASLGGEQ